METNYPYICITTILRNQETVQLLTRIQNNQNISHTCLLMTFHSLDSSQNSGLLHLYTSLEQTCKLFLCFGTKCVFLDTFYFILVIGIEPIKNIRGSRLEFICFLAIFSFFVQYIQYHRLFKQKWDSIYLGF